jgi:Arc/MetJ-type ribon-helix-helix transcriptional regulator
VGGFASGIRAAMIWVFLNALADLFTGSGIMRLTAAAARLTVTVMIINLKPELEQLIQKDIERGPYQSVDEFVERAVQMLHEEESLLANDSAAIHEKVERAFGQFERGESLTPEESLASLERKKADWLKQREP